MKSLSLIAVILIALVIAGTSYADPPERTEKIRKAYRGAAAPDYLMFATEVLSMKETAEWNRDIALQIVQKRMGLDSEDAAEAFLSRMVAAAKELEAEHGNVVDTMLCGPNVPREKKALYQRLDQVDDLQEIKSHNVYVKFLSSLDEGQQAAMTAWLKESKEGFSYRTAEHETSFENVGVDVVNHVDMVCAARGADR